MKNKPNLYELKASEESERIWQSYYDYRTQYAKVLARPVSYSNWKDLKKAKKGWLSRKGYNMYLLELEDKLIGSFELFVDFNQQDEGYVYLYPHFLNPENLNENTLSLAVEESLKFAPFLKHLFIESKHGRYDAVSEFLEPVYTRYVESFELKVQEANTERMEEWLKVAERFPNFRLEFYDIIPDDLLEEFARLFTQLLHDMPSISPSDDLNILPASIKERQENGQKNGYGAHRYLLFNEYNELIGKTNVAYNSNPKSMHQFMTGIAEKYRGLGLAKWLKAAMFFKLKEIAPQLESIYTETQVDNIGSRVISEKMGYKKTGFFKTFLVSKEELIKKRIK